MAIWNLHGSGFWIRWAWVPRAGFGNGLTVKPGCLAARCRSTRAAKVQLNYA